MPPPDAKAKPARKDPRAWDALSPPLADWILDAVASMGFARATPVQAAVLPLFGANKDVVVEAVTGSGKTLAYLIPLVQRILALPEPTKRHHVAAIVVSPTRELASQIHSVLLALLAFHPPSAEMLPYLPGDDKRPASSPKGPALVVPQLLVGGATTTVAQDVSFFLRHSPNVVISTPGRLVELLSSPHVHCPQSSFEALVLDEADRLLDLGFKQDLSAVLSRLPKQRRTGLFSASVSEAVGDIIRVGLRNPVKVAVKVKSLRSGGAVEESRTPASLRMTYLVRPASQKLPTLSRLLQAPLDGGGGGGNGAPPLRTIVFMSTCAAVDYFAHVLPPLLPEGFSLVPLHGKHDARVRDRNFARFSSASSPTVLLTTDVAARGLDFPSVDLVVQVDPPADPKVFIHRCGRAGRAGRKGLSVVLLHPGREADDYVPYMAVRGTPLTPLTIPSSSPTTTTTTTTAEDDDALHVPASEAAAATASIRSTVLRDRALFDKAQRGFVSWARAHGKHAAASIFRAQDVDWADLAEGWGLLRLPRMPELRSFQGDRWLGVGDSVDWDAFAYARPEREKARLEALKEGQAAAAAAHDDKNSSAAAAAAGGEDDFRKRKARNAEAWSGKHEKEGERVARRDKKRRRRDAERREGMTEEELAREKELERMLAEVRARNRAKSASAAAAAEGPGGGGGGKADGDEFEGFD